MEEKASLLLARALLRGLDLICPALAFPFPQERIRRFCSRTLEKRSLVEAARRLVSLPGRGPGRGRIWITWSGSWSPCRAAGGQQVPRTPRTAQVRGPPPAAPLLRERRWRCDEPSHFSERGRFGAKRTTTTPRRSSNIPPHRSSDTCSHIDLTPNVEFLLLCGAINPRRESRCT